MNGEEKHVQVIATAYANLVGITQPVSSYVYDALAP